MNKERLSYCVVVVLMISLVSWVVAKAQECRIIRVHGLATQKSIALEPETMRVPKDSCVVWYNRTTLGNVKISFQEGKACASVTDGGMGFKMGYGECYISSWIPFAGTSSLRFKEKGTYKYIVETVSGPENLPERGEKIAEGTIIVGD